MVAFSAGHGQSVASLILARMIRAAAPALKLLFSGGGCEGPMGEALLRAFPEIDVQVDLHDRQVNLQEDGYDVAIRTGALSDSSLIAKRLAPDRHVVAASSAYLARAGRPLVPEDLVHHQCLVLGETRQWSFSKDGVESTARVNGALRSNNG